MFARIFNMTQSDDFRQLKQLPTGDIFHLVGKNEVISYCQFMILLFPLFQNVW